MKTDLERYGFAGAPLGVRGGQVVVTVDFEAFSAEDVPLWSFGLDEWADQAADRRIPTAFFLAVENAVRLRSAAPAERDRLYTSLRRLGEAGTTFHAHNHYVFDPETGKRPAAAESPAGGGPYGKRRSFFFDAVRRHAVPLGSWLATVRELRDRVLHEAGCRGPELSVFRAGGWDYGSSRDEVAAYLRGLRDAGFQADSSACRGVFGTRTWRVGAAWGENVFPLLPGLLEIAPTGSMDCGSPLLTRGNLMMLAKWIRHRTLPRRNAGCCVLVLHFDHLFHSRKTGETRWFAVTEPGAIKERVDRLFRTLAALRVLLRLRFTSFEGLASCLNS